MEPFQSNEKGTILLVDDSENDRILMRMAFDMAKPPNLPQVVCDGEEAIAYLKGDGPFKDRTKFPVPIVMILDLNLPKMNGFEVLAWVRAQPFLKRLTVIILTASTRREDLERAFDLGATSFLVKPTDFGTLTAMMQCLCDWIHINHFPPLTNPGYGK